MYTLSGQVSAQHEADQRLLEYNSYDEYLDALNIKQDECYLQNVEASRTIAELGYRSPGETLSKEKFEEKLKKVILFLYPPYEPYILASEGISNGDALHLSLAVRERDNRIGNLSTIIFLRSYTKCGFEISGFLDFAEKLTTEDWKPIFQGKKKIKPRPTDLGYYHWRTGKIISNESSNYRVLQHHIKGLMFQNKFDRKLIGTSPDASPGQNTTRQRIYSDTYELVILFDHVVRQKI